MKIVLVDDDPFVLKILRLQLAKFGITDVLGFERGGQALAFLETHACVADAVFCDLHMPEMDGVEFVRNLTRIGYGGSLVIISGDDLRLLHTVERLAMAHQLKVLGALHKPIMQMQLQQILQREPLVPDSPKAGSRYRVEEVRRAIAQDYLVNHYQPKVDLATGMVIGMEALVRWQHPHDGLVYPDQFISVAEDAGLIDALTCNVLSKALRQAKVWLDAGLSMNVAVNVCMDSLVSLEFPDMVARQADLAGVPLTNLTLEVTESRLMNNPQASLDTLTRLRIKHIGLSIDDFGTDHSSMAQLRDIPFTELKVDRGFVHGAATDHSIRSIFEASLTMARELGLESVAEGVETAEDWEFLRTSGCNLAQGYFISKPLAPDEIGIWLHQWESRRRILLKLAA